MTRPVTFDHLKSRKKPVTQQVEICLDSELADVVTDAQQALEAARAKSARMPNNADLFAAEQDAEHELKRAQADAAKVTVTFTFRGIGRRAYDNLLTKHQPDKEQRERFKREGQPGLNYDVEKFPPALVAASLVDPELTADEVQELWDSEDWNDAELQALFMGARGANEARRLVDLGKDSTTTSSSSRSSRTASRKESRTASSSDADVSGEAVSSST